MTASLRLELVSGPARTPFVLTAENGDIRELMAAARDEFGLTGTETVQVNGADADLDTILEEGDEVAFNKPTGQKG